MKLKKLLGFLLLAISFSAAAQPRIAVLNFNAGVGVHQSDVDGLSAIFNTFFTPQGYTVVERTRVSRILEEHKMQGSNLTETDMARLGELLNVPVIVIGDVNRAMGQYNIDVRAVNVETGEILAKDGAEWAEGSSYRETMRAIAERLSQNIPLVEFHKKPVVVAPTTPKTTHQRYYPEGGSLRFTGGLYILSLAYNHQVTPSFMIGGGAGISSTRRNTRDDHDGIYYRASDPGVPLFVEIEARTPRYGWSLFVNAKLGYLIHDYNTYYGSHYTDTYPHFFSQIIGGVSYKHLNLGIGWSYTPVDDVPITIHLSYNLPLKWFY